MRKYKYIKRMCIALLLVYLIVSMLSCDDLSCISDCIINNIIEIDNNKLDEMCGLSDITYVIDSKKYFKNIYTILKNVISENKVFVKFSIHTFYSPYLLVYIDTNTLIEDDKIDDEINILYSSLYDKLKQYRYRKNEKFFANNFEYINIRVFARSENYNSLRQIDYSQFNILKIDYYDSFFEYKQNEWKKIYE